MIKGEMNNYKCSECGGDVLITKFKNKVKYTCVKCNRTITKKTPHKIINMNENEEEQILYG